ncbi:MAG: hypothetical protein LUQ54_04650 [Methanoregula sp.]|nr:hypothetical protein [Methanoregula sp.]
MTNKFNISLLLQCLIFLIPLNIYMWGDWILVDLQWALFRYQQSPYGDSLILGYKDILYILHGQTTGLYNVAAAVFWTIGAAILLIGLLITLVAFARKESDKIKTASYFTLLGGIFLGISALCRFNGGFAVPVGVPLILIIGWWMYKTDETDEMDESDDKTDDKIDDEIDDKIDDNIDDEKDDKTKK